MHSQQNKTNRKSYWTLLDLLGLLGQNPPIGHAISLKYVNTRPVVTRPESYWAKLLGARFSLIFITLFILCPSKPSKSKK